MNKIKFLTFADLHYYPGVFCTNAAEKLEKIKQRAIENNVDMVIHAGDLCHAPHLNTDFVEKYHNFPMPVYHTIGNHENDKSSYEEILSTYRIENGYYYFDKNGFRFIVLDLNYMVIDGELLHYNYGDYLGNYGGKRKVGAYVAMGKVQMQWLEETVMDSPYPCILISHQSTERKDSGFAFSEMQEIWSLYDRVNKDKQKIIMAINGHHHRDNLRIFKNILFFDLNSASMDWLEKPHDKFPKELMDKYSLIQHSIIWNDPLSAVVTVTEDGNIKIEGAKSDYFMGINHETLGIKNVDPDGRICTASIESANIKINI